MRSTFISGVILVAGLMAGAYLPGAHAQVRQAQEMVARAPGSAIAWTELGAAYRVEGMLGESSRALREALRREPALMRAWYELGRTAWARGDDDAVLAIHQKVQQLNPQAASEYLSELVTSPQANGAAAARPMMIRTMSSATLEAQTTPVNMPMQMAATPRPAPTQMAVAAAPASSPSGGATGAAAAPPPNSRLTGNGGWECLSGFVMYEERRCIPLLNR